MDNPKSYCKAVQHLDPLNVHRIYHDTAYGFPINTDNELFERLILEINQAGLSWTTILNKQNNFKQAYHQFDIETVAQYTQTDINRLLNNAGIIRNKLKINAAIENAKTILVLQSQFGSFKNWLDNHHPKTKDEWVKIFKKNLNLQAAKLSTNF
jgi:DNA-3-methyladenine glycosylase I